MDGSARIGLNRRSLIALPVCVILLAGLSVHRLACTEPPPPATVDFSGPTMGTTYSVKLAHAEISDQQRAEILAAIEAELEAVNALMSTWQPDSELSRFNRTRSTAPFPLSPATFEVFEIARQVSERSDGAFDITVGPLAQAWGFGATDRPLAPPSEEELMELRERVGWQRVVLDPQASTIAKQHPEIECDLSAIAKGYAVDRVAIALEKRGMRDYLVEVGGELRGRGKRPDGTPWRVGIERPDALSRTSHEVVQLRDQSLATSGDYRQYYEVEGERVSHTIDPRAGRPIRHALASVSVLHAEAVWADALATALNVLGPVAGPAWAEKNGLAAFFLVREADGSFRELSTPAFETVRVHAPQPAP